MKVCFLNLQAYSIFNPKSVAKIGGTEIQLYYLAKYLALDIDVSFVTGDCGQKDGEVIDGVRLYKSASLEKKLLNYIRAPFIIWSALRRASADIYIASSAGAEIGIVAFFCKFNKKKFIYRTAHQMDCNGEYIKKNGIKGWLFGYGLKVANAIVVQNNEHKKLFDGSNKYLMVIRNAFPLIWREHRAKKESVLWVSRCETWKNPKAFLNIVKRFPQVNFRMISPKQTHEMDLFNEIQREAQLCRNVEFIEKVPFLEIQQYFDEAKIFIGTSDYEGFPNTYVQACIGKTPIVSYRVNPDNFITENNIGYCSNGDFEKMIGYIKKVLFDEQDWKEKSKNAFQYVEKNHNIEIIGKQWSGLLQRILKN